MGRAVDPANPHLEGSYGPWKSYGQSKLANFHFGIGLQRRFEAAGVSAASLIAHPGLSDTDLQAHAASENAGDGWARFFHGMAGALGHDTGGRRAPQLRAATDPDARGGEFYATALGQQRAAGPPADPAKDRHERGDRKALAGLRAGDWGDDRDRLRSRRGDRGLSPAVPARPRPDRVAAARAAKRRLALPQAPSAAYQTPNSSPNSPRPGISAVR